MGITHVWKKVALKGIYKNKDYARFNYCVKERGEEVSEVKICKDCKHCIPNNLFKTSDYSFQFNVEDWENSKCDLFKELDLVVGTTKRDYCREIRKYKSLCGPEAIGWEARK